MVLPWSDAFRAEDGEGVVVALLLAAVGADAAVLPFADDDGRERRVGAADGFAAGAHDREQRFDAVDAVPEQIGMVAFDGHRAGGFAADHVADGFVRGGGLNFFREAERRRREDGRLCFVGDAVDREQVGERAGGRLIDEDRLAFGDGAELFQVRAAIDAFEQDGVGFGRQLFERVDDLDAFFAELFDVASTRFLLSGISGLPPGKAAMTSTSAKRAGRFGVVDELGERDDVRRVAADDADADDAVFGVDAGAIESRATVRTRA